MKNIFDEIYSCTNCNQLGSLEEIQKEFNISKLKYYNWRTVGEEKAYRCNSFVNIKLIHFENNIETPLLKDSVLKEVIKHGYHFIPVY